MAGKYIKGALVQFMDTFLIPLPNVIIFQYNPESIVHTWSQPEAATQASSGRSNPLAVKGVPGESFSFTLMLDVVDMIADGSPVAQGIATVSGIYTRLAALEMLQYPVATGGGGGLLGSVSVSAGGLSLGGSAGGESAAAFPSLRCRQYSLSGGRAAFCLCG